MKTVVVYYSRTGNTRMVAEEIASILNADIDEIHDVRNRDGARGWLLAGRDASRKFTTEIETKLDPSKYDLVIIGTPIWAFTVTPAVRTYLTTNKFKRLAFLSTSGGSSGEKTFKEMERISRKPIATLSLSTKSWSNKLSLSKNAQKIKDFCIVIKTHETLRPARK
jgi:flavodoxin